MRIGIIGAMEVEMDLLRQALTDKKTRVIAGAEICQGRIGAHEVALMMCGIGKVSAGAGAQAMILSFQPDYVINTGCAGAMASGLGIGDMVVATSTAEWDLDTIALGNPRGYVYALDQVFAQADPVLNGYIRQVIPEEVHLQEGLVVSGDQFVSSQEQRDLILSAFPKALCTEMEGAAIGHVCAQNKIPFAVVRCMSDTADGDSQVNFAVFAREAGEKSAHILLKLLEKPF